MRELTIEITDHCPLNCLHCSTQAGKEGKSYLSVDQFTEYLLRFHDFDTVRISGGEPFEHPDIEKILEITKNEGRRTIVLSCGVTQQGDDFPHEIKPEMMKRLSKNIDEIVFSMQGFYDIHDQIVASDHHWTRHPPYWDMMIDSSENAQRAGIEISYHTVLMKANFENLRDIALAVAHSRLEITPPDKKYRLHILRFIKQGRGKENSSEALDEIQLKTLPTIIRGLEEEFNIDITTTNSFAGKDCDCGSAKAAITISREIIPCSALKYRRGSGKYGCKDRT